MRRAARQGRTAIWISWVFRCPHADENRDETGPRGVKASALPPGFRPAPRERHCFRCILSRNFQSVDDLVTWAICALREKSPNIGQISTRKLARTRAEAVAHIREARKGNRLPEGITIRDLIDQGRAEADLFPIIPSRCVGASTTAHSMRKRFSTRYTLDSGLRPDVVAL
jgi:hypothetical protein